MVTPKSVVETTPLVVAWFKQRERVQHSPACPAAPDRPERRPQLRNARRPTRAEHDASIILARWREAEEGATGDAHAGYLAALDREAHAAAVLRRRPPGAHLDEHEVLAVVQRDIR